MDIDSALSSSEYVEYAIIGAHTLSWLVLLGTYVLNVPLGDLSSLSPVLIIVSLPFLYLLGIMVDRLAFRVLTPVRWLIKKLMKADSVCKDEVIAYYAPALYAAYEWRARRTRIPAAAIFNWPLLGLMVGLNLYQLRADLLPSVISATASFTVATLFAWIELSVRAYRFRLNACDAVQQGINTGANRNMAVSPVPEH